MNKEQLEELDNGAIKKEINNRTGEETGNIIFTTDDGKKYIFCFADGYKYPYGFTTDKEEFIKPMTKKEEMIWLSIQYKAFEML